MRAGTPRAPRAITPPMRGSPQKPSRQAKADAVGGWRVTSQKADVHPLGKLPFCPRATPPALCRAGSCESDTRDPFGLLGNKDHVPFKPVFCIGNMDTQDRTG